MDQRMDIITARVGNVDAYTTLLEWDRSCTSTARSPCSRQRPPRCSARLDADGLDADAGGSTSPDSER